MLVSKGVYYGRKRGTAESWPLECIKTFLALFISLMILWTLHYLLQQGRIFPCELDVGPAERVSNIEINMEIVIAFTSIFSVMLACFAAFLLSQVFKEIISRILRATKYHRENLNITDKQNKNPYSRLRQKDISCTNGSKPNRWRSATRNQFHEEFIVAMLRAVTRICHKGVKYGKELCSSGTCYQLIRWEPGIPEGKSRVRWKFVSCYVLL